MERMGENGILKKREKEREKERGPVEKVSMYVTGSMTSHDSSHHVSRAIAALHKMREREK
jgi:hypothetical protein